MKRFLIIFVILSIVLLSVLSCKKINLLAPSMIPQNTQFSSPPKDENIEDANVEIYPKPAQNNEVFGNFQRKFRYKNKWYIMAGDIYNYDANTKSITRSGNNAILQLEDNGNFTVYGRNLPSETWNHLTKMNIIDQNQVCYQDEGIQNGTGIYSISSIKPGARSDSGRFQTAILMNNLSYNSADLLNWQTQGKKDNVVKQFPSYWTHKYNHPWYPGYYDQHINVYFNGKLYVLGGGKGWQGYDAPRNFSKFGVIDWNKDGLQVSDWQFFNYPWGNDSLIAVYMDEEKLYIQKKGNYYWKVDRIVDGNIYFYKPGYTYQDGDIYSTTGLDATGINWTKENLTYEDLRNKQIYANQYYLAGPKITPNPTTPNAPDWVKDGNNERYYKTASFYSKIYFNGKYYYLPIPPHKEILEAANKGETNFTITEAHLKNLGKNQFMTTLVNPDNAKDDDWKLINPLNDTGHSFVWQIGDGNMLFNLNSGKKLQLIDYSKINDFDNNNYSAIINELRKEGKKHRENNNYYQAMYYEAQADILEITIKNTTIEVIKPEEATTHFEIDFIYN